jgi:hypothetical protein
MCYKEQMFKVLQALKARKALLEIPDRKDHKE